MRLLTELTEGSMEPSYATASGRRVAAGMSPTTSSRSILTILAAVLVGFLVTVATISLRSTTNVATQARNQLVDQIQARQATGDDQATTLAALEREIAAARAGALGAGRPDLLAQLSGLEQSEGVAAVTGPGVTITLDDALGSDSAAGDPRQGSGFDPGRVSAQDVQIAVNGMWAAGAEAISVNGQRLTSRAAIRFAGQAILVDFRPLSRPYVVSAIGDPANLQTSFAATAAGPYLKALQDNYSVRVLIEGQQSVTCPAAAASALRYAQGVPTGIPSSSGPATSPATPKPSATKATSPTTTEKRR